jgi:thioredoxin 1
MNEMKRGAVIAVMAMLAMAAVPAGAAQKAARAATKPAVASAFAPLDRWKAAVVAGDQGALAALYASLPGEFAQTPQGRTTDPSEEPEYWAGLRAHGLENFNPKILQMSTPQSGVTVLTLRIEFTLRGPSGPQNVLVSGVQMWVLQGGDWRIYRSQRTDVLLRPTIRLPEPARPNPDLYPDPSQAQQDLDAALAAARKDHKRVLVVFGGNWCYDCHVLDAAFHSKTILPLLTANYHVVHVNVGDGTANTDLARRCEVQPDKVPSLAVLDSDGRLVTSQRNGEFDNAVKIGMGDVEGFLKRWAK